jgi:hypothetical protein
MSPIFKSLNPAKRCFSSEAILLFDKMLIPDPNIIRHKTSRTITCNTLPLQTTKAEILKFKGKPHCKHKERIGPFQFHIIGYREKIDHIPSRIHFFLHKNSNCFAEYRFNAISFASADAIRTLLYDKYLNGKKNGKENFYIEDPNHQRLLFYDNGISLSVKFIDTSCPEATDPRLLDLFEQGRKPLVSQ